MAYELKQDLRLSQKLMLTPQLQLAIKLLQLSRHELVEAVREELESNPILEETARKNEEDLSADSTDDRTSQEVDWQEYVENYDDYNSSSSNFSGAASYGDDDFFERAPEPDKDLRTHLLWQVTYSNLSDEERKLAEFIVGNIADDGYLRMLDKGDKTDRSADISADIDEENFKEAVVEDIARLAGVTVEEAATMLYIVQELDPPGVGARTTSECLLLQAQRLPEKNTTVEAIVSGYLKELARKDYNAIASALSVEVEEVAEAASIITEELKPVPGSGFGSEEARVVIPDAYVEKVDGRYVVTLNDDGLPKLRISSHYKKMIKRKDTLGAEDKGYVQERFKSALWFIKSIHQRQGTLKKVVESIVKFQEEFLEKGLKYMAPLVLRDVAEDIDMHESTVSRVTTSKYLHTPRGIFELKYFFSGALAKTDGGGVTPEYIKEVIKGYIDGEDDKRPLSDQVIVGKLKEEGIVLARRTAAKYREELGFLSSSGRKKHY